MSLTFVPPPGGSPPLLFTWTCEVCRPRVVHAAETQLLRHDQAANHEADFHPPHTVTLGTMRGRRA